MFPQSTSAMAERQITGELLDWRIPACDLMSESQFMTGQQACAQAWKPLQNYMQGLPKSALTQRYATDAPGMLRDAIIDAIASQPRDFDKRLSVDQLCDAALTAMGFIILRDEFGVEITGDRIAFPGRET